MRTYINLLISALFGVWAALPLLFDAPKGPIRFRLLVPSNLTCESWNPIIRGRTSGRAVVQGCTRLISTDANPFANPRDYIQPNEGIAMLLDSVSTCKSGETRSGPDKYYLIVCSPIRNTFNVLSWPHEVAHLAGGHSSLKYTFLGFIYRLPEPVGGWSISALNVFLDIGYVDPTLVLGQQGSNWFRNFAVGGWFGMLALRARRSRKYRNPRIKTSGHLPRYRT